MKKRIRLTLVFTLFAPSLAGMFVSTAGSVAIQDPTSIAKDSVMVKLVTYNAYRPNEDVWSWSPDVIFNINGPVAQGNRIYVEYNVPGSPALQVDCGKVVVAKGYWEKVDCSSYQIKEKGSTYTGQVPFAIKMRNELMGTGEMTLFTGRMKVAKVPPRPNAPRGHFDYYVDHDWTLPIAYIFYSPGSAAGWDSPNLNVAFWVRGGQSSGFDPHILYKGQEVGVTYSGTQRMGAPTCGQDFQTGADRSDVTWTRVNCTFYAVSGWDTREGARNSRAFRLDSNPGDYEVRVLWNQRLSRVLRFKVGGGGELSNGIAEANGMNSSRVGSIVPVQIQGDADGPWNREAWKTDAFYGNPLKGFTAAP